MTIAKKKKIKKAPPKRARSAPRKDAVESDEDILEDTRKYLNKLVEDESPERAKMLDDLQFCTLDQWPDDIRKERENDVENGPRPCLTIDKINQYIVQVLNDLRQGRPGINVRPNDDYADVETAKVLKGIFRNIEDQSNADIAYAMAAESALKIGLGYFRITTEYVSDESFKDQDIFIRPIPNTFSVYLGRHIMPDGSDADRGYVVEPMPIEKFKVEYPKAKWKAADFKEITDGIDFWKSEETITVVEEYCIKGTSQTLYFLADGTTITSEDYDAWPKEAGAKPSIQDTRTTVKKQLYWRKMTGIEVLDKRELPGKYIPIVEVVGRESNIEGQRILWGLVRPAKDSLRMYNYFASAVTEKMGLAPKAPFIGVVGQFETQKERWKKSNRKNYPILEYDNIDSSSGNPLPPPQRQGAVPMEAALLHQMQVIEHDVQTSLGMFKAATGESESQQSGRAILALQKESDTGTYHFGANQALAIRHAGRIILDMIPHYIDTKRILRMIGEDGEVQSVQIDPSQDVAHRQIQTAQGIKSIHNPTVGKYDISITVGPSYNTKRMEAAATFVDLAKGATDPGSAAVMRYLSVKNSDFAYSDEASKMLKALLPPQVLQAISGNEPMPPQAMMQLQKMGQQMQGMQEAGQKLQQENIQLKSGAAEAQAKIAASHQARMAELDLQRTVEAEKARLAQEKCNQEYAQKRLDAQRAAEWAREEAILQARTKIEVAEIAAGATLQAAQISAAASAASAPAQ